MKKTNKIILILIIIIMCMIVPNFVNAASALENFVKSSNFESVTSAPTDELNTIQKNFLNQSIATTLNQAQEINTANGSDKAKKYLENEYNTYMNDYASTQKTCQYIGYRLGTAWKTYNQAAQESQESKANNSAAKKFDELYLEYAQSPDTYKKDNTKLTNLKEILRTQYNLLTKEEQEKTVGGKTRTKIMEEVSNLAVDTDKTIYQQSQEEAKGSTSYKGTLTPDTKTQTASPVADPIEDPTVYTPGDNKDNTKLVEIGKIIVSTIQVVGIVVAVVSVMILGLKYMFGSIAEKAEYKKTMIPYIIGVVMLFTITTLLQIVYNFVTGLE